MRVKSVMFNDIFVVSIHEGKNQSNTKMHNF